MKLKIGDSIIDTNDIINVQLVSREREGNLRNMVVTYKNGACCYVRGFDQEIVKGFYKLTEILGAESIPFCQVEKPKEPLISLHVSEHEGDLLLEGATKYKKIIRVRTNSFAALRKAIQEQLDDLSISQATI